MEKRSHNRRCYATTLREKKLLYHYCAFNDDLNFREIEKKTASMITAQKMGYDGSHKVDKSELYAEDVQLISKDGKIYYLPISKTD